MSTTLGKWLRVALLSAALSALITLSVIAHAQTVSSEIEQRLRALESMNIEHRLTKLEATLDTDHQLLMGAVIGIGGLMGEAILRAVRGRKEAQ